MVKKWRQWCDIFPSWDKQKLVEQWNKYLSVKWDWVQKHFKLHNLKLGPVVVVSSLICWSAADLVLWHAATMWTLPEVVKIICMSWIEWHSCWRRVSAGMWHYVIGWVFSSILKGLTFLLQGLHLFDSDPVFGRWSFAFQKSYVA